MLKIRHQVQHEQDRTSNLYITKRIKLFATPSALVAVLNILELLALVHPSTQTRGQTEAPHKRVVISLTMLGTENRSLCATTTLLNSPQPLCRSNVITGRMLPL